jgi:hypothetical protein
VGCIPSRIMRAMFVAYWLFILAGFAIFLTVGILDR